jgi:hypothetical protein
MNVAISLVEADIVNATEHIPSIGAFTFTAEVAPANVIAPDNDSTKRAASITCADICNAVAQAFIKLDVSVSEDSNWRFILQASTKFAISVGVAPKDTAALQASTK